MAACSCHTSSLNVWSLPWRHAALQVLSATLPSTPHVHWRCSRLWAYHWSKPPANTFFFFKNESFISDQAERYTGELNLCLFGKKKKKMLGPFQEREYLGKKKRLRVRFTNCRNRLLQLSASVLIFSSWWTVKSSESNQQGKIRDSTNEKYLCPTPNVRRYFWLINCLPWGR